MDSTQAFQTSVVDTFQCSNPFAVQEIADALKGVDIPVLVKNPVNPDLELWIGALERLSTTPVRNAWVLSIVVSAAMTRRSTVIFPNGIFLSNCAAVSLIFRFSVIRAISVENVN